MNHWNVLCGILAIPLEGKETHQRWRRDLTCAVAGNTACNGTCMLRGWKDGSCHWDTESGAFDCVCSTERRGVR